MRVADFAYDGGEENLRSCGPYVDREPANMAYRLHDEEPAMRSSVALIATVLVFSVALQAQKPRERDLKLPIGGTPGALDAITDYPYCNTLGKN